MVTLKDLLTSPKIANTLASEDMLEILSRCLEPGKMIIDRQGIANRPLSQLSVVLKTVSVDARDRFRDNTYHTLLKSMGRHEITDEEIVRYSKLIEIVYENAMCPEPIARLIFDRIQQFQGDAARIKPILTPMSGTFTSIVPERWLELGNNKDKGLRSNCYACALRSDPLRSAALITDIDTETDPMGVISNATTLQYNAIRKFYTQAIADKMVSTISSRISNAEREVLRNSMYELHGIDIASADQAVIPDEIHAKFPEMAQNDTLQEIINYLASIDENSSMHEKYSIERCLEQMRQSERIYWVTLGVSCVLLNRKRTNESTSECFLKLNLFIEHCRDELLILDLAKFLRDEQLVKLTAVFNESPCMLDKCPPDFMHICPIEMQRLLADIVFAKLEESTAKNWCLLSGIHEGIILQSSKEIKQKIWSIDLQTSPGETAKDFPSVGEFRNMNFRDAMENG